MTAVSAWASGLAGSWICGSRGRRMRRGFQTRVQGDSSALLGQSVRGAERRNLPSLKIHLDRLSTSKLINSKFESTFDVEIN